MYHPLHPFIRSIFSNEYSIGSTKPTLQDAPNVVTTAKNSRLQTYLPKFNLLKTAIKSRDPQQQLYSTLHPRERILWGSLIHRKFFEAEKLGLACSKVIWSSRKCISFQNNYFTLVMCIYVSIDYFIKMTLLFPEKTWQHSSLESLIPYFTQTKPWAVVNKLILSP